MRNAASLPLPLCERKIAFPKFRFFFFPDYPAWPDQCLSRRPQKNSSHHLPQSRPLKEWHHLYLNNNKKKNHRHFKSLINRTYKSPPLGDHGRNSNSIRTLQQVMNTHRRLDQFTLHKDRILPLPLLRHRYRMTVPLDLISTHTKIDHTSYRSTPQTEITVKMTITTTKTSLQGQTL